METIIPKRTIIEAITNNSTEMLENIIYEAIESDDGIDTKMVTKEVVKSIYKQLEDYVMKQISSTKELDSIKIKLFDGLSIQSVYLPAKDKINNLTGELIQTKEKIVPKAKFTRYYTEKLSE